MVGWLLLTLCGTLIVLPRVVLYGMVLFLFDDAFGAFADWLLIDVCLLSVGLLWFCFI